MLRSLLAEHGSLSSVEAQASAEATRALLQWLVGEGLAAVAAAYGWGDLKLGHGFHGTKQGLRYTISEAARRTVLDRLLALNHQRYAEEVMAGLHNKGAKKAAGKGGKGRPKKVVGQGELF